MHKNKRDIYGVIAANAADIEQREILSGIISKAQELNIDVAVISNIYNPTETSEVLKAENGIYDLIQSDEFDGLILISEAIINSDVQQRILNNLKKMSHIPIVVLGTPLPDFNLPQFHFINTSDEADMEDITTHLIEHHEFTNIHILTGHHFIDASHKRVKGYQKALEKHGIAFQKENVFFGDFWMNSGRTQAKKYISGELVFPQALICCNNYMAYGFLDECMKQEIPIPEKTAVIGYEYIRERRNHDPLLTTYQRNRKGLGESAVLLLKQKIETGEYGSFIPPKGTLISGETCRCGARKFDIQREIKDVQTKATYEECKSRRRHS